MRYFNFQKVVKWCNNIKNIFDYYVKKCGSRNPFAIADFLNIQIQIGQLGTPCGCYMFLKNYRCIFLNENLSENPLKCEFFLPSAVSQLMEENKAGVTVLRTDDRWYGVTYKEDKAAVMQAIAAFKANGVYPEYLWK